MLANPPIEEKLRDIHATFLEPSAGEGAFLVEILRRRLTFVNSDRKSRGINWRYNILWALTSIYGIEFLPDNVLVARQNMERVFCANYETKMKRPLDRQSPLYRSMRLILDVNIVQGDALTHKDRAGEWIVLSEWRQHPKKKRTVLRIPFYYDTLFSFSKQEDGQDLFADFADGKAPLEPYRAVSIMDVWEEERA